MVEQESVGIKSIEVGSRILKALIDQPLLSVTDLSNRTRMSPSKVHRYLVSFVRSGLVAQESKTKLYTLGLVAFQLGIAAISRSDDLTRAITLQREIRDAAGETVVLSVWGGAGPTIVHIEESTQPVIMTMKLGAGLPVLGTAAGLVFAAYMLGTATKTLVEKEIEQFNASTTEPLEDLLAKIRRDALSVKSGHLQPGVSAIAAPLLTLQGNLLAVVAIVTHEEADGKGPVAALLSEKTRAFNSWPMVSGHSSVAILS